MSPLTPSPFTAARSDREYYAELWGTTPIARRRVALRNLRKRSGFVAAVAGLVLAGQVTWTSLSGTADVRLEIGTAGASSRPAAVDPSPDAGDPRQQASSLVAEAD